MSKFCNGVDLSVSLVQMYETQITGMLGSRNNVHVHPTFFSINSLIVMKPTNLSTIHSQPKILCYSSGKWDFYEASNQRTEHWANLTFKVFTPAEFRLFRSLFSTKCSPMECISVLSGLGDCAGEACLT